MKTENSTYTIIYAAVMVLLVALGLSFTHQALSDRQKKNVESDSKIRTDAYKRGNTRIDRSTKSAYVFVLC